MKAGPQTAVLLQKNESRFYEVEGVRLPSVTTVIGATLRAPELERWRERMAAKTGSSEAANEIRDEARDFGTMMHAAAAQIAADEEFVPFVADETFIDGIVAFEEWLHDGTEEILAVEQLVVSRTWHYAGTLDLIRRKKGRKTWTLTDHKTTRDLYPSHRLQTAAYVQAARETYPGVRIDDREVVLVSRNPETPPEERLHTHTFRDQPRDFAAFASLLTVYRWLKGDHR